MSELNISRGGEAWLSPPESIVSCEGDSLDEMVAEIERILPIVEGREWKVRELNARLDLIDVSGVDSNSTLVGRWHATITAIALADSEAHT